MRKTHCKAWKEAISKRCYLMLMMIMKAATDANGQGMISVTVAFHEQLFTVGCCTVRALESAILDWCLMLSQTLQ